MCIVVYFPSDSLGSCCLDNCETVHITQVGEIMKVQEFRNEHGAGAMILEDSSREVAFAQESGSWGINPYTSRSFVGMAADFRTAVECCIVALGNVGLSTEAEMLKTWAAKKFK